MYGYKENMPNYKETTGEAVSWRRAKQVTVYNPVNASAQKRIVFIEEDVVSLGETVLTKDAGFCETVFNKDSLINLRDPNTGELTGNTISQGIIYQALYSLYMSSAEARDAGNSLSMSPIITAFNTNT